MQNLREFLSAVASHWFLLSMAVLSLLVCRFGSFDPDNKIFPVLILVAIVLIVLVLYLAVTEPLIAINPPR
jgi:cation transporter-like permease